MHCTATFFVSDSEEKQPLSLFSDDPMFPSHCGRKVITLNAQLTTSDGRFGWLQTHRKPVKSSRTHQTSLTFLASYKQSSPPCSSPKHRTVGVAARSAKTIVVSGNAGNAVRGRAGGGRGGAWAALPLRPVKALSCKVTEERPAALE